MRCVRTVTLALAALVGGCAAPVVAYRQLPLETIAPPPAVAPAAARAEADEWLDAVAHDLPSVPEPKNPCEEW